MLRANLKKVLVLSIWMIITMMMRVLSSYNTTVLKIPKRHICQMTEKQGWTRLIRLLSGAISMRYQALKRDESCRLK